MRSVLALALVVAAGCSAGPSGSAGPSSSAGPSGESLVATLTSPTDIVLTWDDAEPGAAGRVVEFATDPDGPYTILQFAPPDQRRYEHADLMPQTPFYYRLRPYFGPVSSTVPVELPPGEPDPAADETWVKPVVAGAGRRPVRTAGAAPAGLRATVMDANGIRFEWTDHARDEEGYLVEVRPVGGRAFSVAAVLDPDVTAFGLVTLPTEKRAEYRVRAYYFGPSSDVAHRFTGGS